jgi:hypothetical protein
MPVHVKLIDPAKNVVATAQVQAEEGYFAGQIDLGRMPPPMRRTFAEYEEIVNGQVFSLLDEIEERVRALGIQVVFEGRQAGDVEDLHIYPGTGLVSFKVAEETLAKPTS